MREAVSGREDEFVGIGFILVGSLLGLGIYFNLAGPLGRGVAGAGPVGEQEHGDDGDELDDRQHRRPA